MDLVTADAESATIRIDRAEFADLLAIVNAAVIEYDTLDVEIHNLTLEQVQYLEDSLFRMSGKAMGLRRGKQNME